MRTVQLIFAWDFRRGSGECGEPTAPTGANRSGSQHHQDRCASQLQSSKTETTFHCCWRVKSSFKLVWMESNSPCSSLIGHSLKWRCCS